MPIDPASCTASVESYHASAKLLTVKGNSGISSQEREYMTHL